MLKSLKVRYISYIYFIRSFSNKCMQQHWRRNNNRKERMWNNEKNTEWNVCFWVATDCHRLFRLIQSHPTFVFSAVTTCLSPEVRWTVWVFLYWACGTWGLLQRGLARSRGGVRCVGVHARLLSYTLHADVVNTYEYARVRRRTNVKGA